MNDAELAHTKELAFWMTERVFMNPISAKLLNEDWRKAFPDEVAVAERMKALVEALEKAQVKNALVAGGTEATAKLHERITELESEVEKWKQESKSWEHVAEKQLATAIELESRTVKLPESFKLAKSSSGLMYYFADEVDAAIIAAGIKVEDE